MNRRDDTARDADRTGSCIVDDDTPCESDRRSNARRSVSVTDTPPSKAVELYLDARRDELADSTVRAHESRLSHFVRWCEGGDVDSLGDVSGPLLYEYRLWRRDDGGLNTVSLNTQLSTLRVFLKWCENIDAVRPNTYEKVDIPTIEDGTRNEKLTKDRADEILSYLSRFEYASTRHVMLRLMWRGGLRIGGVHALDVDDYDSDEQQLSVRHRPDEGTAIKNAHNGERILALTRETCTVIDDYLDANRRDVVDDHGRRPLLTTQYGRLSRSGIRRHVYQLTQPCFLTDECPHDRDLDTCEDRGHTSRSGCPSSVSPHDIRRGSITYFLSKDVPEKVVSDRMNVSERVIDKHYDCRSPEQRSEQRRQYVEEI